MKSSKIIYTLITVAFFSIYIVACKKDKKDDTTPEETFDKTGMLSNVGENVIIPAYAKLKIEIDSLQYFTSQFTSNPNATNLNVFQTKLIQAYIAYQGCSSFEFGPGENELIRAHFNIFPCDTTQINTNISSGVYNLATADNTDAKGFPALDFLLFRNNQNSSYIVSLFTTNISASNAKNYLIALVNELKNKTDAVNSAWSVTGGNYINTFKNATGNDIGSSTGMLINQLNYDFELLKNAQIGIPLGKKTAGVALPEKVEAYYSTQSLILVKEHLKSIENIYLGRSSQNADGLGLDDYLIHLNAQHSSGLLNDVIKNKFASLNTKLAAIPESLSQTVITNPAIVDAAYSEILQLLVLLKIDLPAATGVLITYADNDGD